MQCGETQLHAYGNRSRVVVRDCVDGPAIRCGDNQYRAKIALRRGAVSRFCPSRRDGTSRCFLTRLGILEAAGADRSAPVDVVRDLIRRVIQLGGPTSRPTNSLNFSVFQGKRVGVWSNWLFRWSTAWSTDILADGTLTPAEDVQLRGALLALFDDSPHELGRSRGLGPAHRESARRSHRLGHNRAGSRVGEAWPSKSSHAWLKTEKSKTRFVAGNAGVTVPIGRLRVRGVGGTSGEMSESEPVSARVDFGEVTVTTTRTVFTRREADHRRSAHSLARCCHQRRRANASLGRPWLADHARAGGSVRRGTPRGRDRCIGPGLQARLAEENQV